MHAEQTGVGRGSARGQSIDWYPIVRAATLAPSSHNSQPWLFRTRADGVDVIADLQRRLPIVDPNDRELYISCGAALENLLLALRHSGNDYMLETAPDRDPELVARVTLAGRSPASADEQRLYEAIPERRTTRVAFESLSPPRALLDSLRSAASLYDVSFEFIDDTNARNQFSYMTMQADRTQAEDAEFRGELANWVRRPGTDAADGMPTASMGLSTFAGYLAPFVIRTFDVGDGRAARDRDLVDASPTIGVLCTPGDLRRDWVAAGRALERVALTATAAGYSLSYINQTVEVPEHRHELTLLLQTDYRPQLVLRVGRASVAADATPRRPVADVLDRTATGG